MNIDTETLVVDLSAMDSAPSSAWHGWRRHQSASSNMRWATLYGKIIGMLTIGQLAKRVGVRTSTLRYYEEEGLLPPSDRSPSGYRLYTEEDEQTLRFIQRAQRLGFALEDIRILLERIDTGRLQQEEIIQTAEERYLTLERQITQLLVLRHEMGLFLQDLHQRPEPAKNVPALGDSLFVQLVERICTDPGAPAATAMLDWLLQSTGCPLTTAEAEKLLASLRGQHVHIWQENNDYHILVVSNEAYVGETLQALAQLEAECQVHQHTHQIPEVMHNDEGYLLICRGNNAFIFARLFLAISA